MPRKCLCMLGPLGVREGIDLRRGRKQGQLKSLTLVWHRLGGAPVHVEETLHPVQVNTQLRTDQLVQQLHACDGDRLQSQRDELA